MGGLARLRAHPLHPAMRIALLLSVVLLASGCANLLTGGPLVRDGEPTGTIVVENASRVTLNVVLISTCSASTYGLNRLPRGTGIPPGARYPFTVSAGCWDVDAGSTATGGEARQRMSVAAGGTTVYTVTG